MSITGKIVGNVMMGLVGIACLIIGIAEPKARGAIFVGLLFAAVAGLNIQKLLAMQREASGSGRGGGKYSILDLDYKVMDIGHALTDEAPKDWRHFDFFIERSGNGPYACRVVGPGDAPFRPSYAVQRLVNELNAIIYDRGQHTRLLCSATQKEDGSWTVKMAPEKLV